LGRVFFQYSNAYYFTKLQLKYRPLIKSPRRLKYERRLQRLYYIFRKLLVFNNSRSTLKFRRIFDTVLWHKFLRRHVGKYLRLRDQILLSYWRRVFLQRVEYQFDEDLNKLRTRSEAV